MDRNTTPVLIIPAFQPEDKLLSLVDGLVHEFAHIVVVDDGSSDRRVFDSLVQKYPSIDLLRHARNLGKGAALKTAFNHVLVSYPNSIGVVTADADGQHRAEDIRRLAQALLKEPRSIFMGARSFKGEVPLRSRFGNELTKLIFRFLLGKALKDTQTGLRAIPLSCLGEALIIPSRRYEFELDFLVAAVREKWPIREVEIATIYEPGNPTSHFNPVLDSLRIYFVFFRFLFISIATAVTDISVFTLCYWSAHHLFASVLIGRVAALFVSLLGSKFFVFRSKRSVRDVLPRFLLLWATLLMISYGLTFLLVERLGLNAYLARLSVDGGLFLFNFAVQRSLIFSSREVEADEPGAG